MSLVAKILIVGESGTGKSALLYRFISGNFREDIPPTIGIEVLIKEFIYNGNNIILQLWDFSGQAQFRHMWHKYTLGALGAIVIFDLSNLDTLKRIEEWISICRKYDNSLPILLLGTKSDLLLSLNSSDDNFFRDLISKYSLFNYIKTSAKNGINIELAFEILIKEIINQKNRFNYIIKKEYYEYMDS
ncbi:MAG: Rab family GTPase [Promethearchaeota archaeon]